MVGMSSIGRDGSADWAIASGSKGANLRNCEEVEQALWGVKGGPTRQQSQSCSTAAVVCPRWRTSKDGGLEETTILKHGWSAVECQEVHGADPGRGPGGPLWLRLLGELTPHLKHQNSLARQVSGPVVVGQNMAGQSASVHQE
jgi:hypothetical protein